jgi:predicted ATPase
MTKDHNLRRPLVVELVGPAGAGKSALSERLARRPGAIRASVWNLPRGSWLWNAARSLPTLLGFCARARSLPWADMKHIIRLRTLREFLARQRAQHVPFVVLDEGPVFALGWLRLFGHERMRGRALAPWWRRAVREWAQALDVLVLLDAPDRVLTGRIRTRTKEHQVKEQSDREIAAFTAAYRQAFADVISAITAENGIRLLALECNAEPVDRTAERLLDILERAVDVN